MDIEVRQSDGNPITGLIGFIKIFLHQNSITQKTKSYGGKGEAKVMNVPKSVKFGQNDLDDF